MDKRQFWKHKSKSRPLNRIIGRPIVVLFAKTGAPRPLVKIPKLLSYFKFQHGQSSPLPWRDCVYRVDNMGKTLFLFPNLFNAPVYYNRLMKDYKY